MYVPNQAKRIYHNTKMEQKKRLSLGHHHKQEGREQLKVVVVVVVVSLLEWLGHQELKNGASFPTTHHNQWLGGTTHRPRLSSYSKAPNVHNHSSRKTT